MDLFRGSVCIVGFGGKEIVLNLQGLPFLLRQLDQNEEAGGWDGAALSPFLDSLYRDAMVDRVQSAPKLSPSAEAVQEGFYIELIHGGARAPCPLAHLAQPHFVGFANAWVAASRCAQ